MSQRAWPAAKEKQSTITKATHTKGTGTATCPRGKGCRFGKEFQSTRATSERGSKREREPTRGWGSFSTEAASEMVSLMGRAQLNFQTKSPTRASGDRDFFTVLECTSGLTDPFMKGSFERG